MQRNVAGRSLGKQMQVKMMWACIHREELPLALCCVACFLSPDLGTAENI